MTQPTNQNAASPVQPIPGDQGRGPFPGIALCLSGGGYRAMLFHVGALWRMNELALLPKLARVSSVSGGSIAAGVLGGGWADLAFVDEIATRFRDVVVDPIRALARRTIDLPDIAKGLLLPGTIGDYLAASYRSHLFGGATLQDLPDRPRFVINATNVQSGVLWRFSKPYMWDWRVGKVPEPTIELAVAVAASSAFPPVLSPARLALRDDDFEPGTGDDLQRPPFTESVLLTDGGVYDNLGIETAWKLYETILVSDGGGKMAADPDPQVDWPRHALRINEIIDNQVRSLRKRQVIGSYKSGERSGAYWGIRSHIGDYGLTDALPCPVARTTELAEIPTRLAHLPDPVQEELIDWGYAICDAALRRHVVADAPAPAFPHPARFRS